jgi:hypothetical protein
VIPHVDRLAALGLQRVVGDAYRAEVVAQHGRGGPLRVAQCLQDHSEPHGVLCVNEAGCVLGLCCNY